MQPQHILNGRIPIEMHQIIKIQTVRGARVRGQKAEPFLMQRSLEMIRNSKDIFCTQGARDLVCERNAAICVI